MIFTFLGVHFTRYVLNMLLLLLAVFFLKQSVSMANDLTWSTRMEFKLGERGGDYVLEGMTVSNEILLWAGLYLDDVPWIDVIKMKEYNVKKLAFRDAKYRKEIIPTVGKLNKQGDKLVFMENWSLGIYDFVQQAGYLLKHAPYYGYQDRPEHDFLIHPKWFSDKELAVLSFKGWREIRLVDIDTSMSRTVCSSPTLFIADYDVSPVGIIVAAMGPAHERLIRGKLAPDVYTLDEFRAEKINLYMHRIENREAEQLTKGTWYDFAPKISSNGKYVAFLRGKKKIIGALQKDKEYTLSDTDPVLYVYDLQTKKEKLIVHNPAVKTSYDFLWRDGQTITFIKSIKNGTALYDYNVRTDSYRELYKSNSIVRSFVWSHDAKNIIMIERRNIKDNFLVVLPIP